LLASVDTPVEAIAPGIVVFAKEQGSYGKVVIINHADGLQSRYAQLNSIKVTLGQKVNKNDILGTVGTTGQPTSSQPHLHFEMRFNDYLGWKAKDPQEFLEQGVQEFRSSEVQEFRSSGVWLTPRFAIRSSGVQKYG
jgi:murein DD-endopeptidase MepM/ murein hydrolase activator NlpD